MNKLYLGVARVDITPKIGANLVGYMPDFPSESIHDNLDATAFVFRQGDSIFALIGCTVAVFQKAFVKEMQKEIEAQTGIPATNIIMAITHTHTGPFTGPYLDRDYCDNIFKPRVLAAVKQAKESLQPVTMGYAFGDSFVAVNRREPRLRDNKIVLGQCPWGPFDPRMTVITFRNAEGKTVGSLVHYGCHGTAAGMSSAISQDWSGVMVRRLETLTDAPVAFVAGVLGDVGPRLTNGQTTGNMEDVEELGGVAAQDATRIFKSITQYTDCDMKCATGQVRLPLKKRISLEEAQQQVAAYAGLEYTADIMMREHFEQVVDSYENGYEEKNAHFEDQTLLRIGNIVFATFGYEIFSEIGLRIQKECKDLVVLPLSYGNGGSGYFPTQSALAFGSDLGGYEVQMFRIANIQEYVDDADYHLICSSLDNIEKVI